MTSLIPSSTPSAVARRARTTALVGSVGLGAGTLGALHALVLATFPPAVRDGAYSYPFGPDAFAWSQGVLSVRDLALAALLAALSRTPVGSTLTARAGLLASALSMLCLAVLEVASVAQGDSADLGGWYGLASFGVGLGMLLAGVRSARVPQASPWRRFLPLAIGGYVFVVLTPAILLGFASGQVAIAGWMLMFARLGWETRTDALSTPAARRRTVPTR